MKETENRGDNLKGGRGYVGGLANGRFNLS
jgi:hypothetical protein